MAADDVSGPKDQPRFLGTGAPSTAADLSLLGDYAALVGNSKALTASERTALTGKQRWPGLTVVETDTGKMWLFNSANSWQFLGYAPETTTITLDPLYVPRAASVPLGLHRVGPRVFMDGAVDVAGNTTWTGGTTYTLGTLPAGWRPTAEVGAITRFGTLTAVVTVVANGAITFALSQTATAAPGTLNFALTGISWPIGG